MLLSGDDYIVCMSWYCEMRRARHKCRARQIFPTLAFCFSVKIFMTRGEIYGTASDRSRTVSVHGGQSAASSRFGVIWSGVP